MDKKEKVTKNTTGQDDHADFHKYWREAYNALPARQAQPVFAHSAAQSLPLVPFHARTPRVPRSPPTRCSRLLPATTLAAVIVRHLHAGGKRVGGEAGAITTVLHASIVRSLTSRLRGHRELFS